MGAGQGERRQLEERIHRCQLESISRLVGHRSTMVTETIYRKQLRPVVEGGAEVMDLIFPAWPRTES
jgi:hypothetical protein